MGVTVAMARNKPRPATCECSLSQQKDSGIKIIVVDQHGAVIPKAEITVEGKLIKEPIAGVTGPSGEWNQTKLTAGRYKVTVKAAGFSPFSSFIEVHDGTLLALKMKLPVAAVNTVVEVKAEPPVIMGTVGVLTEVHQSLFPPAAAAGQPRSPMREASSTKMRTHAVRIFNIQFSIRLLCRQQFCGPLRFPPRMSALLDRLQSGCGWCP